MSEQALEDDLDRDVAGELGELREVAEPQSVGDVDQPLGGLFLSENHPEHGRLAAPVAADESNPLARLKPEEHVAEHLPAVEPLGDLAEPYETHLAAVPFGRRDASAAPACRLLFRAL